MSRLIDENAIIKMLNTMDRYTSEELTLCDTNKTFPKNEVFIVDDVFEGLDELPSAQPEHTNSCYTNSWCIDCKEYDTENKCCPRYNRVIKQMLDEVYAHAETEAEARYHAEIVRCKDCRYRDPEDHKCDCGHDIIWQLPRDDKWYCADAGRRTDG